MRSVAPPGLFPGATQPSPWSRAGRGYRAANGTSIKNLGQLEVPFATTEGFRCRLPFQVAEVGQPCLIYKSDAAEDHDGVDSLWRWTN